jgi:hypothetical protein
MGPASTKIVMNVRAPMRRVEQAARRTERLSALADKLVTEPISSGNPRYAASICLL